MFRLCAALLALSLAVIAHEKDVLEPGRCGALCGLSHDTEEDLRGQADGAGESRSDQMVADRADDGPVP